MKISEFLTPSKEKVSIFLVLFFLAFPSTSFQINFPCIQGQGCPSTEPVLMPMALSFLYSLFFPQSAKPGIRIDFAMLALGAVFSCLLACAIAYAHGKYVNNPRLKA